MAALLAGSRPAKAADFSSPEASRSNSFASTDSIEALPQAGNPPTAGDVARAAEVMLYTSAGEAHRFEDLLPRAGERRMFVFIRHFFCGLCQDYTRALSAALRSDELAELTPPTSLIVIGCGEPELIKDYITYTDCTFPIYAEPSRKLYDIFGLVSSMDMGSLRPTYQTRSVLNMAAKSIVQGLSQGTAALKGGNFSQVGGEFLFEGDEVVWSHRMRNTRDHTETYQIRAVLGLP